MDYVIIVYNGKESKKTTLYYSAKDVFIQMQKHIEAREKFAIYEATCIVDLS